jgi:glycosyltransferase involved in cell wall biosynthesis
MPGPGLKVLYTAFDAYPGVKGAQAHIRMNLRALAVKGGRAALLCLGPGGTFRDQDSGALVHAFASGEENLLRRSELFGRFLMERADALMADPPAILHFRDIWSGIPLLQHRISRESRLVFEVNGLPSVELPGRYPQLIRNHSLMARLRKMEEECLGRADRVITVCRRTALYLSGRGCDHGKIAVIPNAVDSTAAREISETAIPVSRDIPGDGRKVILYVGTLAPWQGLPTFLKAVQYLRHRIDFRVVVAASGKKGVDSLRKRIRSVGLDGLISIFDGLHHRVMPSLYQKAYLSVAPLARGARNEVQGCCPLKIIESMGRGTPVVASDLPVVRELIRSGSEGLLVPPDSPRALAGALELLMDNEVLRARLALGALEKAKDRFGTGLYGERLGEAYKALLGGHTE